MELCTSESEPFTAWLSFRTEVAVDPEEGIEIVERHSTDIMFEIILVLAPIAAQS
jgi:hypothetical protein